MAYRPRPASPTNTTFSGISKYQTDSYRPIRDRDPPQDPQAEARRVAKTHYEELQVFLSAHVSKEAPNTRSSAREKLTRLTKQQFQELSTDVYDELIRRNAKSETPHLPNREDFHPKRNQARQKLSTLPKPRFKDLASDVYFELGRRYPEFRESEVPPDTPDSVYEEFPSDSKPSQPATSGPSRTRSPEQMGGPGRMGQPNGMMSTLNSNSNNNKGPDRRPTPEQPPYGRRSEENRAFGRQPSQASRDNDGESTYSGARRRPSNDTDTQYARKMQDQISPGPSSATAGVVIPNKSTIAEEEIQVPYGRDSRARDSDIRDSVVTDGSGEENFPRRSPPKENLSVSNNWDRSPSTPLQGGLSALAAGLKRGQPQPQQLDLSDEDDRTEFFETSTVGGGRARSGSGSSNATRRKMETRGGMDREETEKMRKDYEYRITSLQSKNATLQEELDIANKRKREDEDLIRELRDEIGSMRSKQSDHSTAMREVERRLADERSSRERSEQQMLEAHTLELKQMKKRCEDLESEKRNMPSFGDSTGIIEDLKAGMESLLEEVKELASRNDELTYARDEDEETIRELRTQMTDYKKKYERAKTELRNLKATSSLFLQKPKHDNHLPTSRTGAIQDMHITAFQSASDDLLSTGRSDNPSRVLNPMKEVVDAVSAIIEDVRSYDLTQRSEQDPPVDWATVDNLCERTQATLSNLVTASKTHATSYGLSPVSLLDAALSHVSASVTELAKLLLIRSSSKGYDDEPKGNLTNGRYGASSKVSTSPLLSASRSNSRLGGTSDRDLRSAGDRDLRGAGDRDLRGTANRDVRGAGDRDLRDRDPRGASDRDLRSLRDFSEQSSSSLNSPPSLFDEPRRRGEPLSPNSVPPSAGRGDWNELKPYLESQSELLVQAIQGVLTAVRNPTPSPELNENVTQIITIVSSIVAISRDSLPQSSYDRGLVVLNTLSEHCNKLSEVQAERSITKDSRQVMAQSSFAIASSVKDLMKL
ncbi:component of the polarisome [Serendipita sp. 405]|nr:component of the polarisome [Serendipita sp. 405]